MCVRGAPEMTGYRSKKMMSDIRWLGPYAPTDRHVDDVTLAHVVDLRKKVADQQRHIANLESYLSPMRQENNTLWFRLQNLQNCLLEIRKLADAGGPIEALVDDVWEDQHNAPF